MKTKTLPVLRRGSQAYFDGLRGPIPCTIDSITSEQPMDVRPGSWQAVTATVTADGVGYRKGQPLQGWGVHFFPRTALEHSGNSMFVKRYEVQA